MMRVTTKDWREVGYVVAVIAASLLVQRLVGVVPGVLLAALVITHTLDAPLGYLGLLAVGAEIGVTSAPGIMTLAILWPWLLARLVGKGPDVSLVFALLVMGSVVGQLGWLLLPDVREIVSLMAGENWYTIGRRVVPWSQLAVMSAVTGIIGGVASIVIHFNWSHR